MIGSCLFMGIIYFVPSLIAVNRRHHNSTAIFVLNLCLGWSFIGWVVSLVWALTKVEPRRLANPCYHEPASYQKIHA